MTPERLLDQVIHFGVLAADHELLNRPVSTVPNPDGSVQLETTAEQVRRVVGAAVRHLVNVGLLAVPDDAPAKMEAGIPLW